MSALPDSWAECLIGDVTHIVAGGTPPSKEASNFTTGHPCIPWITPADLSGYKQIYISYGARSLTEKGFSKSSAKKMPAGSVLFSSRAPIGYVAIAANEISTNQGFKSFVLPDGINNHFVYYYLKYIKPIAEEMATGTTFKELSGAAAAKIPLIVAPSKEQKRIADKLDAVLARVDACRDRLDHIPAILKRFRQSVLAAATSGKLTEVWRNQLGESMCSVKVTDPYSHTVVAPNSWRKTSFGEVCDLIGGSQPPKSTFVFDESEEVVRLIQIRDYKSDKFKVFIPRKLARRFCNKSEVMIGRYGPPIFQILRGLEGAYNVALMKAEPKIEELELDYLFYWLKGETLLRYVESGSERTAGQDGIRKELLNVYPFFLPPKDEQTEIVRRVEALFAFADRLEARHTAARAQVEKLTPATLAKAFRGELVPQDSNDEPASMLLERIRTKHNDQSANKPKRERPSLQTKMIA